MALIDRVKQILNSQAQVYSQEDAQAITKKIAPKIKRLKVIMTQLKKIDGLLTKKTLSVQNRLHKVLDDQGWGIVVDRLQIEKGRVVMNDETQQIINLSYEAYELTMSILSDLRYITNVNVSFVHNTKTKYARATNLSIPVGDASKYFHLEVQDGALRLRTTSTQMRKTIVEEAQSHAIASKIVEQHYQHFIQPYISRDGWKPNWGVVAEAFERHWEMLSHSLEKPESIKPGDVGSVGDRWVLYRLSSGNDPFYTGPDTEMSQVKNTRASILSDLSTLINAMQAIITLLNSRHKLSQEKLENYKRAFGQQSPNIQKILDSMDQDMAKDVSEELVKYLQQNIR